MKLSFHFAVIFLLFEKKHCGFFSSRLACQTKEFSFSNFALDLGINLSPKSSLGFICVLYLFKQLRAQLPRTLVNILFKKQEQYYKLEGKKL